MKIDKNISILESRFENKDVIPQKYTLKYLEIKNSFLIPYEEGIEKNKMHSRASGSIANFNKKYPEKKFVTRQMDDGIRIWRIK